MVKTVILLAVAVWDCKIMYVGIDNKDMNVHNVMEWINTTRDANGYVISPEFAMEILSKTNFYGHIKKVLKHIRDNSVNENGELIAEKILPYKEFILSCVDGREMSNEALKYLREFAGVFGKEFCDEFEEINTKKKIYNKDCCEIYDVYSVDELREAIKQNKVVNAYLSGDKIELLNLDMKNVNVLKVSEGTTDLHLAFCDNLPRIIDAPSCETILFNYSDMSCVEEFSYGHRLKVLNFTCAKNLPSCLDFSGCSARIVFEDNEFSNIEKMVFGAYSNVDMKNCTVLPREIYIGPGSKFMFNDCNMACVNQLNVNANVKMSIFSCYDLPKEVNLSACSEVNVSECDFVGVEKFVLPVENDKTISLSKVSNLPVSTNFSEMKSNNLTIKNSDLSNFANIKFGNSYLRVSGNTFAGTVDFSECSSIRYAGIDDANNTSLVKKMIFKDSFQYKHSPFEYFRGYICYNKLNFNDPYFR